MKIVIKNLLMMLVLMAIVIIDPVVSQDNNKWIAPPESKTTINPNKEEMEVGKVLFQQACAICHGELGKGDGLAGIALKPRPANLTDDTVYQQSDGELFWKISKGKTPMPTYENVYSEEQRWSLINYIRSLKKGNKK